MLCQKCKKNQATKTYEYVNCEKRELQYYCLDCYHKTFLPVGEKREDKALSACPFCGMSAAEVKKRNLVGCAYCYTALYATLQPMIVKMQGERLHGGKTPYIEEQTSQTQRRRELEVLAEKCYADNDDIAAGKYEEQISRLLEGYEEVYVWDNRISSKQL